MVRVSQYLVVIYTLEQSEGTPVSTGRIVQELDRSPSAATEMIQRLEVGVTPGHREIYRKHASSSFLNSRLDRAIAQYKLREDGSPQATYSSNVSRCERTVAVEAFATSAASV